MPKKGKKSQPTGISISNFSDDDVRILTSLFSVLANEKRLDILKTTIAEDITRLKDLATELGEKNSAQIALHAKKLLDSGLLKKEGESLRDDRKYIPTIIDETYIFLRIALKYAQIVNSHRTELELQQLKANAEAANKTLAESPALAGTVSFSDISTKFDDSLELAHEEFNNLVSQFSKMINLKEI